MLARTLAAAMSAALVSCGGGGSGSSNPPPPPQSCARHADCPLEFACSGGVCVDVSGDTTRPTLVSFGPQSPGGYWVGETFSFAFSEPIRLGSVTASVGSGPGCPSAPPGTWPAEVALSADEKTITVKPLGVVAPACVTISFAQITDNAGNLALLDFYTFPYPLWLERSIPRFDVTRGFGGITAAVDDVGSPVVAWAETSSCDDKLRARRFDGAVWQDLGGILNADPLASAGTPSLAARAGTVALAWAEGGCQATAIHVATLVGAAFARLAAPATSGTVAVDSPSIAIDLSGKPLVAWRSELKEIRAARWDGASWTQLGVVGGGTTEPQAMEAAAAFKPDGTPCVAFHLASPTPGAPHTLHVRCWGGAAWQPLGANPVVSFSSSASGISPRGLDFSPAGDAFAAYAEHFEVKVAVYSAGAWSLEGIQLYNQYPAYPELGIDLALGPVAAWDVGGMEIGVARRDAGSWAVTDVVSPFDNRFVGGAALAVGPVTGPWIPFSDGSTTTGLLHVFRHNH